MKSPQSAANCPLYGNYHLAAGSPAIDAGANRTSSNGVPTADFDGDGRAATAIDIGADEVGATAPPPPAFPAPGLLDSFNRANGTTLGASWTQLVLGGSSSIRVNSNQASCPTLACLLGGYAYWSSPMGARQAASATLVGPTLVGTGLVLKANGTLNAAGTYPNFIRVSYKAGAVAIETTTSGGGTFTTHASFTNDVIFNAGDRMTALADANGVVAVWRTRGAVNTYIGQAAIPATGSLAFVAGGGRIGMQLPPNGRVDDYSGATVP